MATNLFNLSPDKAKKLTKKCAKFFMSKWQTSQNDALGIWELIPDENIEVKNKLFIPLHSHNDALNTMVSIFF